MLLASFALRMPPPGYQINGVDIHTVKGAERMNSTVNGAAPLAISEKGEESTVVEVEVSTTKSPSSNAFAMTLWQALTSKEYIMMYIMFFCAEITGLLIISKIQSIVQNQLGKDAKTAANVNSILGGCNLLGRLVLPTVSDFIGQRKPLFVLSLTAQTIFLAILPKSIGDSTYALTLVCAFVIAFCYGGGFGLIPAFLADQFGSKNVGATHGVILTAWSIAGVCGGLIFNAVYNSEKAKMPAPYIHAYDKNFHWILAFTSLGIVMALLIAADLRERRLPRLEGETLRFRFLNGRLVRMFGLKAKMYSKQEEDEEWERYLAQLPHVEAQVEEIAVGQAEKV